MNGNERSTRRDFERDDAPDPAGDAWPGKFAAVCVRLDRSPLAGPKMPATVHLSPDVVEGRPFAEPEPQD